jgi:hypothetical protein
MHEQYEIEIFLYFDDLFERELKRGCKMQKERLIGQTRRKGFIVGKKKKEEMAQKWCFFIVNET